VILPAHRLRSWRRSGHGWPSKGGVPGCWHCAARTGSGRGAYFPVRSDRSDDSEPAVDESQPWTATAYSLLLLRDFGIDPECEQARQTVALVRDNCRWEQGAQLFFTGEVEPCINGMTVALGAYFDQDVDAVVARLLGEQLEDGGWNCWAEYGSVRSSFAATINVLEGLLRMSEQPEALRSLARLDARARSTFTAGVDVGPHPGDDRPDGAPRDPHQLRHRVLGGLGRQPRDGLIEGIAVARVVTGPRHPFDDHPMLGAGHPRGVGLQHRPDRAQVQPTPPAAALAGVVTGTATTTYPAPAACPARGPHMSHQQLRVLVELDPLDDRLLDAQQATP
jgi:hypothetical protein